MVYSIRKKSDLKVLYLFIPFWKSRLRWSILRRIVPNTYIPKVDQNGGTTTDVCDFVLLSLGTLKQDGDGTYPTKISLLSD